MRWFYNCEWKCESHFYQTPQVIKSKRLLESHKNLLIYKRRRLTLREDSEVWSVIAGLNAIGAPQSDTQTDRQ